MAKENIKVSLSEEEFKALFNSNQPVKLTNQRGEQYSLSNVRTANAKSSINIDDLEKKAVNMSFIYTDKDGKSYLYTVYSALQDGTSLAMIGNLEDLQTINKDTLVSAINEVLGEANKANTLANNNKKSIDTINSKLVDGTTERKGLVQLSSAINSTSESTAATSKAVKTAYDKANSASSVANTNKTNIGSLSTLITSAKTSLVAAINELKTLVNSINTNISSINGKVGLASLTKAGIVQLNSATNSTSETTAATPKAVKTANDRANSAYNAATDANIVKKNVATTITAQQTHDKPIKSNIPGQNPTYITAAKDNCVIVTNGSDNKFVPFLNYKSGSGVFIVYGINNTVNIGYISDANISGNKNTLNHAISLLNDAGLTTLKALTTSGTLTSNGNTVTKNIDCNGNIDVSGTSTLHGKVTASGGGALSGTWTVPTPATSDNSTKIATTAFVKNYIQANGSNGALKKIASRTMSTAHNSGSSDFAYGYFTVTGVVPYKPMYFVGKGAYYYIYVTSKDGGFWQIPANSVAGNCIGVPVIKSPCVRKSASFPYANNSLLVTADSVVYPFVIPIKTTFSIVYNCECREGGDMYKISLEVYQ